jgi:hypothetical protein
LPHTLRAAAVIAAIAGLFLFAAGAVAGFALLVVNGYWPDTLAADLAAIALLVGLALTWGSPALAGLVRRLEQQRPQPLRVRPEYGLDLRAPGRARSRSQILLD